MANPHPVIRGPARDKPFREAINMERLALATGEIRSHPKGSLRWIAQRLLFRAGEETAAQREVADRLDGKVPQGVIGGDEGDAPVRVELTDEKRLAALKSLLSRMKDDQDDPKDW